jgi:hypothetical protein
MEQVNPGPAYGSGTVSAQQPQPKEKRPEPQETLPTDRVAFGKQMQFLLAYAAASENGTKGVSNETVAELVKMKSSTVSLANAFFVKSGFLTRSGREYIPAKEVLEYKIATGWNDPNAAHKLAPLIERTWFAQALRSKLEMRGVEESEAIGDLAQRAVVTRDYEPQLRTMIEYMTVGGVVRKEGTLLILNRKDPASFAESAADRKEERPKEAAPPQPAANSGPFMGRGSISLAVNIEVDMAEVATWCPERIAAFFSGLAAVVAAKRGERHSS